MILSKGWVPERSSRTDPLKENRRKFFPISPIVFIFRLYPRRLVLLSIRDLRSSGIYKENELKVANLCKHSRLSHRQKFHLNSALPKQLKIAQVTHTRGGWNRAGSVYAWIISLQKFSLRLQLCMKMNTGPLSVWFRPLDLRSQHKQRFVTHSEYE